MLTWKGAKEVLANYTPPAQYTVLREALAMADKCFDEKIAREKDQASVAAAQGWDKGDGKR